MFGGSLAYNGKYFSLIYHDVCIGMGVSVLNFSIKVWLVVPSIQN